MSSPREREKRDRRDSRGDERGGQGRKRNRIARSLMYTIIYSSCKRAKVLIRLTEWHSVKTLIRLRVQLCANTVVQTSGKYSKS